MKEFITTSDLMPITIVITMLVMATLAYILVRRIEKVRSIPVGQSNKPDPAKRAIGYIPEFEYVIQDGETFVTMKQVKQYHSESELENFAQWMNGQTCGVAGIYSSDYERWLRQGKRTQQGKDWD